MRKEDFLKKIGLDEPYKTWIFGDGDDSVFAGSWKDYVCYQPASSPEYLNVYYLTVKETDNLSARMVIEIIKSEISVDEYVYIEDAIEAAVLEALTSFPAIKVDNSAEFAAARTNSAKKTGRGSPQYNIGNGWFYKGTTKFDGPLFVSSADIDGETKYAIWKQDNFEDYGFVME